MLAMWVSPGGPQRRRGPLKDPRLDAPPSQLWHFYNDNDPYVCQWTRNLMYRGLIPAWSDYDIVLCLDGKSRRIESGTFPLATGVPNRVGHLRGYGNSIVPQVAATFIRAYMDCRP
jgi:hypothetical protein